MRNDPYLALDVLRIALAAACFWLAVITLRMGWMRWSHHDPHAAHPLVHAANALMLVTLGVGRLHRIGDTPDWQLLATIAAVSLTAAGLLLRVRFRPKAPTGRGR